jgi:hypothetical protein
MAHPNTAMRVLSLTLASCLIAASASAAADAPKPAAFPPEAVEFFEKNVRPVLADSCVRCHGAQKQSSGLRLDSRQAVLEGGDNGPAVVPGEPDKSLLVQAVRYTHEDVKMPPKTKLPEASVQAIATWVKLGAPWSTAATLSAGEQEKAAPAHWAFQPVRPAAPPRAQDPAWCRSPIDAFVLAKLKAQGMHPARPADRRTLIRRATFDLTGLPPTPAEVAAFEADPAPDAFAKVVDRLLASPRYGERWGRHWLDVARYADTKGYVFQQERRYPYSYTYRDYVVNAFNDDKPYDRFVVEQIAADRLPAHGDNRQLAALGFLTVGRRFLNNNEDIIDDRIDVVTRGLLGLTVACARCHDHKYDPIPTDDYYSLYGVFASSEEPAELPVLDGARRSAEAVDFERAVAARRKEHDAYLAKLVADAEADVRGHIDAYLRAAFDLGFNGRNAKLDERAKADKLHAGRLRHFMERWKARLNAAAKAHDPVLAPWQAFAALPGDAFKAKAADVAKGLAEPGKRVNPVVAKAFAETPPAGMADVAARYGALLAQAESRWREAAKSGSKALAEADWEALRQVLHAPDAVVAFPNDKRPRWLNRDERNKLQALAKKIDEVQVTHAGAPPRAMVLNDRAQPVEPRVLIRGNPGRPGKPVPRRFVKLLSAPDRKPFRDGSGRLELAQAIARADNPLTARVLVNRVWLWHFGQGLVDSPSDFGLRCEAPAHPELLDYLADQFVRDGWSIKALHRRVMLSAVYQQAGDNDPKYTERDPQNRLLWKFNRQRLDFEAMRDALLAVSGRLDATLGGRPVPITEAPFSPRRTLYGFIDRQNLDGMYRSFDFASPDATSPRRFVTTVPQQALFLMNSPFVMDQARSLAALAQAAGAGPKERVAVLYQRLFGRAPTAAETAMALEFVARQSGQETPAPTWQYGYGGVDESAQRVTRFEPFAHWTGNAWQPGPTLPMPEVSYVHLSAQGGHTGPDAAHAAVRRWTAREDGVVSLDGTLRHDSKQGDGVRGRIVSSRSGVLGTWVAHNNQAATRVGHVEVRKGETIDFVADCRSNDGFDSFSWSPTVRALSPAPASWSARDDFQGPSPRPLSPWEEYAQVLLLTNEFMFVD